MGAEPSLDEIRNGAFLRLKEGMATIPLSKSMSSVSIITLSLYHSPGHPLL
jgi:hypothetical protein